MSMLSITRTALHRHFCLNYVLALQLSSFVFGFLYRCIRASLAQVIFLWKVCSNGDVPYTISHFFCDVGITTFNFIGLILGFEMLKIF